MGFFGFGSKAPEINVNIPEIKLPTAQELFAAGEEQAKRISPLAFGAREKGLSELGQLVPEAGFFEGFQPAQFGQISPEFFEQFQPTSFEEALGQQQFANIFPDVERGIKHDLSLSGIESSPILAQQLARARGELGVDIGNILAQLGQRRGELALGRESELAQLGQRRGELALQGRQQGVLSQLGISPQAELTPLVSAGLQQSQAQAELQRQRDLELAQISVANQIKAQQDQGGGLGRVIGAGLGAIAAPFTGGLSLLPAIGFASACLICILFFASDKVIASAISAWRCCWDNCCLKAKALILLNS